MTLFLEYLVLLLPVVYPAERTFTFPGKMYTEDQGSKHLAFCNIKYLSLK